MHTNDKIYIAGHTGMVGSSIVRRLRELGYRNLVLKTRKELDLSDYGQVSTFFKSERPDYVILAAAKCGGIGDNVSHHVDLSLIHI